MTRTRYWLFVGITVLLPFALLAGLEFTLRATWRGGAIPVFVPAPAGMGDYLMPNPALGKRYFGLQAHPPAPLMQPFAAHKPANGFRVFALGASTTAGFPWPPTGTFPRLLQDVLHDAMPADSVEVINLAIPATNSYSILDQADAVIAQHPDAVVIYSGQNEYYGALGVGSTESVGSRPWLVRTYLWLERFRTFMLLRDGVNWARRSLAGSSGREPQAASFMEVVAGNQQITLGGRAYEAGIRQFRGNLQRILGKFRAAHVPVFIASLVTNERDMRPFASPANAASGGADALYDSARAVEARGDTVQARELYVRARDLDVVRFRAPSAFNDVIREVAQQQGATFVPVLKAFRAASPGGVIGHTLILEHLHPNQAGQALIAREFWDAMDSTTFAGHSVDAGRVKPWPVYVAGMDLTPFDRQMVHHTVQTLTTRWPFVPVAQNRDYRGTYRPTGRVDSLAFMASAGFSWSQAKLDVAEYYETHGFPDSAFAEYRGLIRELPIAEPPWRLGGHALLLAGDTAQAIVYLQHALDLHATIYSALELGVLAARAKDYARAVTYLRQAVQLDPRNPQALYQLSLASALNQDIETARATAMELARTNPDYPGLAGWLKALGLVR